MLITASGPARPVQRDGAHGAGSDGLLPVGISIAWVERAVTVSSVRRGEHRDRPPGPGQRHHEGLAASQPAGDVAQSDQREAGEDPRGLVAQRVRRAHRAVGQRRLRDHCGKTMLISGPGGEAEQVPRGEREAPSGDLAGRHAGKGRGAVQRGLPVGPLIPNQHHQPRRSARPAEVAVIEGELAESFRAVLADGGSIGGDTSQDRALIHGTSLPARLCPRRRARSGRMIC